ncbi:MAG: xanthine phosphoribosyltransferase [Clostridia bacterium]|nr:xanthine phosphoribosyltransferase [Clostridia bacterium]
MLELEEKILKEGKIINEHILKVGSFLNQQIDVSFLMKMGEEISRLYEGTGVTKILTIESSGIAIATVAAAKMNVPFVFAKKDKSNNIANDVYSASVHSFTHGNTYDAVVSKEYLDKNDKILIIDDFLARGNALHGLISIVSQAEAELVGVAIAIEKGFQGGGDQLREKGIRIESLALIDSMSAEKVSFRR